MVHVCKFQVVAIAVAAASWHPRLGIDKFVFVFSPDLDSTVLHHSFSCGRHGLAAVGVVPFFGLL